MTIVEEEIMNHNEDLEVEIGNGGEDGDDPYDYPIDDEAGSDVDEPPHTGNPEVAEWMSLTNHPAPTVSKIRGCLRRIAGRGRSNITIMVLGKASVGKSSTVNSVYASGVTQAVPFHMITYQPHAPLVVRKKADGVVLTMIDTPGLIESDTVSETGLKRIAHQAKSYPVDVVIFVDRVDMHQPDELDRQMMNGLTRMFGSGIWSRMVIGLTRADIKDPVPGQTYDSMINRRVEGIREIMRKAGGRDAPLPYVLIENSDRCQRNAAGEKVLENGVTWIPAFFEKVVDKALLFPAPYRYDPKTVNIQKEMFTKFCIIPMILLVQVLAKFLILDRVIADDGLKGDRYGPFDMNQREYEKERLAQMKSGHKAIRRSAVQQREREISLEDEISESDEEED